MPLPSSPPPTCCTGRSRRSAPLVLDSPHSGFAFPADFGSVLSEFDLREGEDCFVDQLWLPATERGIGLIAALAPRTYIDFNRHAGDIDLDLIEGGRWPDEHVPSGKARIGKALVGARSTTAAPSTTASSRSTRCAPDRALSPAVPRRGARPHRRDARALRPQLAHRLPFDERRRRRAGRRRRRPGACRLRPRRPRRHDLRRRVHRARARRPRRLRLRREESTIRTRASSSCARIRTRPRGRMSLQLEINKRLYMDEATRRRATASTACRSISARSSTRCSTTRRIALARDEPMSVGQRARRPPPRAAQAQRRLEDAGEHRQGRSDDALGQSVHGRRVRQRRRRRRAARRAGCAARSRHRAASSRPRRRDPHRARRPQPRLLVRVERPVPRRSAAEDRERAS